MKMQHLKRRTLNALVCGAHRPAPCSRWPVRLRRRPPSSLEAATYAGADRQQHLVDAARKEGELMIYTSVPVDDMAVLTAAFEKKYGIKVKVWRAGSEKVLQRAVTETRANRFDVDIIETNGPELESLHREKMLQEVKSPYLADLIAPAILPHREWVGTRLNIFAMAYNTKPGQGGRPAEDLPGPARSEMEGQARHRGGGPRLVRRRRSANWAKRRASSCSATSSPPTACRCARATRC